MRIGRDLYDDIVAHARQDAPDECCGMIGTRDGVAVVVHRAENAAHSPLRYEIAPQDQYRIEMAIEDAGLELGVIYHSHTRSDPYPSQTDINLAFHPDALYVIIGVTTEEAVVRAFRIVERKVEEVALETDG